MRAKLSPTFTSGKMKMMFGTVLDICEEMINYMSESSGEVEVEMKDILARFTTDVIGNVAFGLEMNTMRDPDSMFRKMGKKVFNPPKTQTMKIIFLTTFRRWAQNFGFRVVEKDVSDFFMSTIEQAVEYRESNKVHRNDFFNLLLELKNHGKLKNDVGEAGEKLSVKELAAQCFLFFLAGELLLLLLEFSTNWFSR
jgi:cytochrome P450 family 6